MGVCEWERRISPENEVKNGCMGAASLANLAVITYKALVIKANFAKLAVHYFV